MFRKRLLAARSALINAARVFGSRRDRVRVGMRHVPTFCLFHSYFRLEAWFSFEDEVQVLPNSVQLIVRDVVIESHVEQKITPQQKHFVITLEAMIDRESFPEDAVLELGWRRKHLRVPVTELMRDAEQGSAISLDGSFREIIAEMRQENSIVRPRMLDIGGRARSGLERRQNWPECDVTTVDIQADPSVDVVGDAHELSRYFPPASFDLAHSVSVFEHLLMPWKVALEINHVLRPGGYVFIHSHQTIGMHDLPWDFWRFSDSCWQGLFNARTGFEIVQTSMQEFMHVVPRVWGQRYRFAERSGGFEGSTIIARKVAETDLEWDVPLSSVLSTGYPEGRNEAL